MLVLEFLIVFGLSFFFIRFISSHAHKIGFVDIPNDRSTHCSAIPHGGGVGFFLSFLIVLLIFHPDIIYEYIWTLLAIGMIFLVGVLDDHNDTSPKTKFIVIFVSTIFLFFDEIVIDDLGVFFGFHLQLEWLALPFTIFAVTGFTNALNLIDGLDGLASGISLVILGTFLYVGIFYHDQFMIVFSSVLMVSLSAFLFFNWHPAKIFMGDSGSLTLGFIISVLAIKSLSYLPTVSVLFIAAIPILDTLVVIIRRKGHGRSSFSADKCHTHHILYTFFADSTPRTVIVLILMQSIYSVSGVHFDKKADEGMLLVLFILNVLLIYMFLGAMIKRQKRKC